MTAADLMRQGSHEELVEALHMLEAHGHLCEVQQQFVCWCRDGKHTFDLRHPYHTAEERIELQARMRSTMPHVHLAACKHVTFNAVIWEEVGT